jgi:hypothetical protein
MRHNTQFFVEYFALDLLMNSDGKMQNKMVLILIRKISSQLIEQGFSTHRKGFSELMMIRKFPAQGWMKIMSVN